jgi:flagellar assembly protein FliH
MSSFDPERGAVLWREEVELATPVSPVDGMRQLDTVRDVLGRVEEARLEAERLLQAARAEAEAIRQQAYAVGEAAGREAGYEAGYAAGLKAALEELAAQANAALAAVATWEQDTKRRATRELAGLAARAAAVLYGQRIEADPDHVVRIVEQLLDEAGPHPVVRIEVSPLDLPVVLAARDAWTTSRPAMAHVSVAAAPELARGACRVLTEGGWVERDWPARLDDLVKVWQEMPSLGEGDAP